MLLHSSFKISKIRSPSNKQLPNWTIYNVPVCATTANQDIIIDLTMITGHQVLQDYHVVTSLKVKFDNNLESFFSPSWISRLESIPIQFESESIAGYK
jgi:hypothetical protein